MADREAFLAAIAEAPMDNVRRCIYADWLDERGEVEEATRQREWVQAFEHLSKNFVNPYWEESDGDPLSYSRVLDQIEHWQRSLIQSEEICFDTDEAPEHLYDENERRRFYYCLEIVTGTQLLPEIRARATFRCAC